VWVGKQKKTVQGADFLYHFQLVRHNSQGNQRLVCSLAAKTSRAGSGLDNLQLERCELTTDSEIVPTIGTARFAKMEPVDLDIQFAPRWTDASGFEEVLRGGPSPHIGNHSTVYVRIPANCSLMTDACVRLLSLLNQLDHCTRRVVLSFEDGEAGTMGYLNRIRFFDHLSPSIEVLPIRPEFTPFHGKNPGLVEIERIDRITRDSCLLDRLTTAVRKACAQRKDVAELEGAAWTIFAELIDNVFSHSQTPLDGFAALQVYPKGNCLKIAVSDSGLGILETLRPSLRAGNSRLSELPGVDLIVEVFRQGLSRHGANRGCGLPGCASKAIKFGASLDLRLPTERVWLVPSEAQYRANKAYCFQNLPLIWGTHICFTLQLDNTS